jgi:hypothetical protein
MLRLVYRIPAILCFVILAYKTHADTFEFVTYTAPAGWTHPSANVYQRLNGIGLIKFSASPSASESAADEFRRQWSLNVEPVLTGSAPEPELQQDGEFTVAVGARQVDAQGTVTVIALTVIAGQGRAISILTMSAGEEVLREVTDFLNSISIKADAPVPPPVTKNPVPSNVFEVDFEVPHGYARHEERGVIVLTPKTVDDKTPCAYGISPSRPSGGTLETDARNALLETLPGWDIKSGHYNAIRGISGDGWPYFWFRTDVQRLVGGSYEYATAMTMAFPAGSGKVNIVWGLGSPAGCTLQDISFSRLLHSLRPRGWNSDGGKSLLKDLQGTWRNTESMGVQQYKFLSNGRYEYGIGTITTDGIMERSSAAASDGVYELRGSELTIKPDRADRALSRLRVRIYDEFLLGRWTRAMSLLDENGNPPLEVQYMRVLDP